MTDLAARLEAAEQGSRELDEEIALALGVWKVWLSKHRRWNFDGPEGRHFSWPDPIPHYDSSTGDEIKLSEAPWSGWCWDADLPEYTTSVDDGLALLREMPGEWDWGMGHGLSSRNDQVVSYAVVAPRGTKHAGIESSAATPALALAAALVRAHAQETET